MAVLCGFGLLLPLLAHGQSEPAAPSPGDTLYTSMQTALWASSDAVELKASLPPETQLIVDAVQGQRLRVRSEHGTGWVSQSALDPEPAIVRRSTPGGGGATGVRPSWRAPVPVRHGHALAIPRLALYDGRDGAAIVSVVLSNPSRRQTVKSVHLGLVLYDRAPDSTAHNVRRRTVRVVGPLESRTLASYDVRIPEEARRTCLGIRWVRVERLDGTAVTSTPRPAARRSTRQRARSGLPYAGDDCLGERNLRRPGDSP